MKKLLVVALLAFSAPAFAGDGGGSDGCGLGWQVTQKKSFLATTTRATTNAVVPPTFGMTSGTIGCDQHSFAKNEMPALHFIASNMDALLVEMSVGGGENLEALARTMGVEEAALARKAQANYSTLVASGNAVELYKNLKAL